MPIILGLLAIAGAAYFWMMRARNAAQAAQELSGVAQDVMAAARRFGFRRKLNLHAVESVDEPDVAIAATGVAFLELAGLPTTEQHDTLLRALQSHLGQSHARAQEAAILGRWLVTECGGPQPAITRLAKRIQKLDAAASFAPLMNVLKDVAAAGRDGISPQQTDAIAEIARIFRIT